MMQSHLNTPHDPDDATPSPSAMPWAVRLRLPLLRSVLATLLIVMALIWGILRFAVAPEAANHKSQIEALLGDLLAEKIRIGALSARLEGLDLALTADDACILDPRNQPALCLARLEVDLDTLKTLFSRQPALHRLHFTGTDLTLIKTADGSVKLAGLSATGGGSTPLWLLTTPSIELRDTRVNWLDEASGKPAVALGAMTIRLRGDPSERRMAFEVDLPISLGESLAGQVDLTGHEQEGAETAGRIELSVLRLRLAGLAALLPELPVRMTAGELSGHWAGDWSLAGIHHLTGDMRLTDAVLARPQSSAQVVLSLSSQLDLSHEGAAWQLALDRFQLRREKVWPETRIGLAVRQGAEGKPERLGLTADYLDLGDLATLMTTLAPLDSTGLDALRQLAPQGSLHQLKLSLEPAALPGAQWDVQAEIKNLALQAWQQIPGLQGVGLQIQGNDRIGSVGLTLKQGGVDLPRLGFKANPRFDRLQAHLDWQQTDEHWDIGVHSFDFERGAFRGQGDLHLILPKQAEVSPTIDLRVSVHDIDIETAKNLMPFGVIPHTSRWLDNAMSKGLIRRCELILRGPTRSFPYKQGEGLFETVMDVENAYMTFHPQWLPLTETWAHLRFHGPGLDIESHQGRIGQAQLGDVNAHIDDLNDQPWLELEGTATSSVADAFDLLMHSPIRRIPEQLNHLLTVSGNTLVSLKLKVPLDHRLGDTDVTGSADFRNAGLWFKDLGFEVSKVEGPLHFTRDRLSAAGIRARFLNHPIVVKVDQDEKDILIDAEGFADVPALKTLLGGMKNDARNTAEPAFWSRLKGGADYRLHLGIPQSLNAQSDDVKISIQSSLEGFTLDLPEPLGKAEQAQMPLSVDMTLRQGSDTPIRASLGNQHHALLQFTEPLKGFIWKGGSIALGRALPDTRVAKGLALAVHLADADLSVWGALQGLFAASGENDVPGTVDKTAPNRKSRGAGRGGSPRPESFASDVRLQDAVTLDHLALEVDRLHWQRYDLGDVQLSMDRDGERMSGTVAGRLAEGQWQFNPQQVSVELEHLRWPEAKPALSSEPAAAAPDTPSVNYVPDSFPALDLKVRHLWLGEAELGELVVDSEKRPGHIKLHRLSLTAPGQTLVVEGDWKGQRPKASGGEGFSTMTTVQGHLKLDDLGQTLDRLKMPGQVRDTPTRLDFAVSWLGAPHQWAVERLMGHVNVALGKGGLPRIEPGLGRVLGILNLGTFWRRLSLDFSDLFGEGLAYDGVVGSFRFDHGQALTEGLLIDAVAAKILMSGRAGLLQHDLDQTITVIPHTTASLPIAGALAGGPAVGAAIFVAQRLIGEKLDSMTASHYSVKGSWQAPHIEKMANAPSLEWLNKAWNGIKDLSGLGAPNNNNPR